MENTQFLTAIEEEISLTQEKSVNKVDTELDSKDDASDKSRKSDLIDFGAEPGTVKVRKPRAVDQFFAKQADACLLSPIKASSKTDALIDPTQESLELKLDGSEINHARTHTQPECVQPNDSTFTLKDDTLEQLIEGSKETKENPQEVDVPHDSHSRKRLQDEMEPAVFDVPRGSKMQHREKTAVPEFHENIKPSLQFLPGNNEPFKPKITGLGDNEAEVESRGKSSDEKTNAETDAKDEPQGQEEDTEAERPSAAAGYGNVTNQGFNMTLDMTLRTSGGVAFASGLFLAIDEALDPVVGALVPYGRRRRGTNIVAVCIPVFLAIYFLLFR